MKLETEIRLARLSRVPVLITAPPDRALDVAHAIAAGGKGKTPPAVVVCDGAALISAARGDRRYKGATDDEVVLVIREVHALSDTEQAALMQMLSDKENVGRRRIIATSSVSLLDRVEQGTFDATLFYRLNAIHIVSHSGTDGARAARPCRSNGAGGSSWGSQGNQSTPFC